VPLSPGSCCGSIVTGAIFGLLFWRYGLSLELGVLIFYACLFIIIFVIDLEHQLILNRVVYPAMVVALLLALAPLPWLGEGITDRLASAGLGAASDSSCSCCWP